MKKTLTQLSLLAVATCLSCSSEDSAPTQSNPNTGGAPAASTGGSGGSVATGGSGGNVTAGGSGGSFATGGNTASDGNAGTGGDAGTGGNTGTGGDAGTGGSNGDMAGTGGSGGELDADGCPLPLLVGWATQGPGTTGGGDATPIEVSGGDELRDALSGDEPRVVLISGTINTGGGEVKIESNKTLRGTNKDATIRGGLSVGGNNVIVQNLTVNGNGGPSDTVNGNGSNIWFDHLNLLDGDDGILDLVNGADMITTSWSKVYYSESMKNHGHRLALLFGNDSDKCEEDGGRQRHTVHHNWFGDYVKSRMPRIYFGRAHIYNNYYNTPGNSYNIRVGTWAAAIIENNHFQDTNNPHEVSPYPTFIEAVGNIYENTSGDRAEGGNDIGVIDSRFDGSACHAALPMPEAWVPPYSYTADPAESVRELVQRCAGPR